MWRKTLYITEEQNRRLKAWAAEAGVSRNELIRRALDEYLKKSSAQYAPGAPQDTLSPPRATR